MSEWHPSPRVPDGAVHEVDGAFARYRLPLAKVERLATGTRWAEGPVWFGDARMRTAYAYINIRQGRFGIGGRSVPTAWANATNRPECTDAPQ